MHNLNLLPALGLLSALGRATPVLRGYDDFLSPRQWSEVPVREPTFISQPISEVPVPTFVPQPISEVPVPTFVPQPISGVPVPTFVPPHYSLPPEPSWVPAPEPTEVFNSLEVRQAQTASTVPSAPISSDIGSSVAATSIAPSAPISSDIGTSVPATSIVPSAATSLNTGPSVSVLPSSEPTGSSPIIPVPTTQVSQATGSAASLPEPSQTSTATAQSTG